MLSTETLYASNLLAFAAIFELCARASGRFTRQASLSGSWEAMLLLYANTRPQHRCSGISQIHIQTAPVRCYSSIRAAQASQRHCCRALQDSAIQQVEKDVTVTVETPSRNARHLYAGVDIAAPIETVWQALTDYDGLADFIPGLAENRCLERKPHGAQLLQVGEQDIALGAKFRATVVLDIQEYSSGVPQSLCRGADSDSLPNMEASSPPGLFPEPRSEPSLGNPHDIAFSMVKGDFVAFRGIWRMQGQAAGRTRLSYSLHVQPQPWLPIRFIQSRIEGEIKVNLCAVRDHSETQWTEQKRRG